MSGRRRVPPAITPEPPWPPSNITIGRYRPSADVRFSNRPFGVKHFQTIRRCGVDVAHGLVLLFGIGTRALPSWDLRTKWSDLRGGLTV